MQGQTHEIVDATVLMEATRDLRKTVTSVRSAAKALLNQVKRMRQSPEEKKLSEMADHLTASNTAPTQFYLKHNTATPDIFLSILIWRDDGQDFRMTVQMRPRDSREAATYKSVAEATSLFGILDFKHEHGRSFTISVDLLVREMEGMGYSIADESTLPGVFIGRRLTYNKPFM